MADPQDGGVVAQLTDLGRGLVHEAQQSVDDTHGAVTEQGVVSAVESGHHGRIVEVEPVVAHHHVQAGAVATADLETIEGRERVLDGQHGGQLGGGRVGTAQIGHGPGGAEAVATDGPRRVLQPDDGGVERFERAAGRPTGVEFGLEPNDLPVDGAELLTDASGQQLVLEQRLHAGEAAQQSIDRLQQAGRLVEGLVLGTGLGQDSARRLEELLDLVGGGDRTGGFGADDRDDAAHEPNSLLGPGGAPDQSTSAAAGPGGGSGAGPHELGEPLGHVLRGVGPFGLDHHPDEGLGPRRTDQYPTVLAQLGLDLGHGVIQEVQVGGGRTRRARSRSTCGRRRMASSASCGEGHSSAVDHIEQLHRGQQPVARGGQVAEDHVAGLLAAERPAALVEGLEHVAIADRWCRRTVDVVLGHPEPEPEVGHHGDHHGVVGRAGTGPGDRWRTPR